MPVYKLIALRVNNEVAMGMPYYAQNRLPLRNKDFTINNEPKEEVYGLMTHIFKIARSLCECRWVQNIHRGILICLAVGQADYEYYDDDKRTIFSVSVVKSVLDSSSPYCLSITNPAIMLSSSINTFLNKPTARTIAKQVRVI